MKLKLSAMLLLISLFLPLQVNALSFLNSTESADKMRMKMDASKEMHRERRQETHEAKQARREELKHHLQTLRDQNKRKIIERIDTRMASSNTNVTARLSSVLERIQSILNKIIEKAGLGKTKGLDTTLLDSATASAQIEIDNAKAIVASQSAMIYVVQIASESALRENVGSTVSELRMDLKDAHKAVMDAKQAVMKAAMELSKLKL